MDRLDTNVAAPIVPLVHVSDWAISDGSERGAAAAPPPAFAETPPQWLDERVLAAFAYNTPLVV